MRQQQRLMISRPLPEQTISALGDRGYRVEPHGFDFGDVQVIWRDGRELKSAADPRDRGVASVISFPASAAKRE